MSNQKWASSITLPRVDPSFPLPYPWASGAEMNPSSAVGDPATHLGKMGEMVSSSYVQPLGANEQQIARPQHVRGLGSNVDAKFFDPGDVLLEIVRRLACQSSDANWNQEFNNFKTFLKVFTGLTIEAVPGTMTYRSVTITASSPDQVGFNYGHGGNTFDLSTGETKFINSIYENTVTYNLRNTNYKKGADFYDQIVFNTIKSMNEYILSVLYQMLLGAPSIPHAMSTMRDSESKPFDALMETYEKTAFSFNTLPKNVTAIFQMLYNKLQENLRKPIPSQINMFVPSNGVIVGETTYKNLDYDKQGPNMELTRNRAGLDEPRDKEGVVTCIVRQLVNPDSNKNVLHVSYPSGEYVLQQDPFSTELGKYFSGTDSVEYISIDAAVDWIGENLMENDGHGHLRFMNRDEVEAAHEGELGDLFSKKQLDALEGLFWTGGKALNKIDDIDDRYLPRSLLRGWLRNAAAKDPSFYSRFKALFTVKATGAPATGAPITSPPPTGTSPTGPPSNTATGNGSGSSTNAQAIWKNSGEIRRESLPASGKLVNLDWLRQNVVDFYKMDEKLTGFYQVFDPNETTFDPELTFFAENLNSITIADSRIGNGVITTSATLKDMVDWSYLKTKDCELLIKGLADGAQLEATYQIENTPFLMIIVGYMIGVTSTRVTYASLFKDYIVQLSAPAYTLFEAYIYRSRLPYLRGELWRLQIDPKDREPIDHYVKLQETYCSYPQDMQIVIDMDRPGNTDYTEAQKAWLILLNDISKNAYTVIDEWKKADEAEAVAKALIALWRDNDVVDYTAFQLAEAYDFNTPGGGAGGGTAAPATSTSKASAPVTKIAYTASGDELDDIFKIYLELPLRHATFRSLLSIGAPLPYAVMLLSPLIVGEGDTAILTPRNPDYEVGRLYVSNPLVREETSVTKLTVTTCCEATLCQGLFEPSVITQFPMVLQTGIVVKDRNRLGTLGQPTNTQVENQETFDVSILTAKNHVEKKSNILAAFQPWGSPPGDGKSSWMTFLGHYIVPDSSPVKNRIKENQQGLNVPFGPFLASKIHDLPRHVQEFKRGPGSHGVYVPAFGLCRRVTSYEMNYAREVKIFKDETIWPASFGTGSLRKRTSPGDNRER